MGSVVVVGVDGSESSVEALRVALEEARLRRARVRAVHVWHVPEGSYLAGFAPGEEEVAQFREAAGRLLADAVAAAGGAGARVPVEQVLREGFAPAPSLIEEAEGAGLLVVGSRGLGGVREAILGSVSHECCRHAACPVLVVRTPEPARPRSLAPA